jgi:FkbM family methyltransferase
MTWPTHARRLLGDLSRQARLLGRHDDAAELQRLFRLLRMPKHHPGSILWRGRSLRYADAPALYHQLADIYVSRVYDFACDRPAPRILDVGGHIGLACWRFREQFPAAKITTFEPDPGLVSLLRANLATTGDSQTEVIAAAAWTREGTFGFSTTGDDSGSLDAHGSLQVPTVDLARFCEEKVDFIKLDIEGAEFDVLAHLVATGALNRVQRLFIELHQWQQNAPRFHEVLTSLKNAGFNYRIHSAVCLGTASRPAGLSAVNYPANLITVYAWRE